MNNASTQVVELKRTPSGRVRMKQVAPVVRRQALENLLFHRDSESVSERFSVHRTDLIEELLWHVYDQMRSGPRGPASVVRMPKAA